MKKAFSLVVLCVALMPAILFAQIPRTISYQGVLTDNLGAPKPNGRYFFTFNLYDVASGGAANWTQAESLTVDRGLFSTTLGQTAFGPAVLFDKQYWLGIQVGTGTELTPRVKLTAGGYSINSISADSARIAGTVANNSITSAKILNGTILFADFAQNGATNGQVVKWNGSAWVAGNDSAVGGASSQWTTLASDIYYNGGNVGIGAATAPGYKLDLTHGGATGLHVKSTSSFSVVDIDAQSGDAALRFQKAGVNQWNMRNRPSDNYLEFFELGGGGSRVVIQDSTGFVGIGETTHPTYILDVLHNGSNGAHIKAGPGSAGYSTVDIDANNGDASVRLQKAGVNQWSMRNRPTDNYLEFTDVAAATSRMVIQNGTGNVGIGETTSPAYRLDVLHGGSTGIRSRSSASFSVVDIDAFSGDAALRFQRAGVGQWNIRNNPVTDDLQFFELGGGGERMRIENTTGNVAVVGTLSKGAGSFKIDHPLDPENKYLYHSFVESPDMMNIYNGNIVTDGSGKAVVALPDYFEALNMDFRYQLTVIGAFAQAIISKKVANNQFEIATSQPGIEVSWMVTGVRHDAFANKNRIPRETDKEAVNRGKYLHPAAFNLPAARGIGYDAQSEDGGQASSLAQPRVNAPKEAIGRASGGSLDPAPASKVVTKPVENTGSVVDDTRAPKR
jgi:hypothetical protein